MRERSECSGPRENQAREGKAQGERREEREVEDQEGHEGEEEMTTQEKYVDPKKEANSMHEENDVSNVENRLVDPCGQRTTHADGARPLTNMTSSQKGSRTGSR